MRVLTSVSLAVLVTSAMPVVGAPQSKVGPQSKVAAPTTATAPAKALTQAVKAVTPPSTSTPAADAKPSPLSTETYSYDAAGRRDPFLNLIGVQNDARNQRAKGEGGAAGMTVSEISVRGVLQSRGKLVAMVMGPDNKTYIVHQGDKLLDGSIKLITPQGLVIDQEVNDPLSVIKQREVRKLLRGLEDAK